MYNPMRMSTEVQDPDLGTPLRRAQSYHPRAQSSRREKIDPLDAVDVFFGMECAAGLSGAEDDVAGS
jgi:hypothetical protein